MKTALFSFFGATISLALVLTLTQVGSAQVRSSSNYQLQSDSINVGGGLSSSTNYQQESSVGEIATGRSDSSNYSLRAGYQQMQEVYLSMTDAADVVMDTDLPGITGGTSNGSTTVTVITDSPAGYSLTIRASGTPAMQKSGGASIADHSYKLRPDYNFTVGGTGATFGFRGSGVDIQTLYLNNGAGGCGPLEGGTIDTFDKCWIGFGGSTERVFASGSNANHPSGATTTAYFRVGINSGAGVESGIYIATTTLTALPL